MSELDFENTAKGGLPEEGVEKLLRWIFAEDRPPAQIHFSEGADRIIAKELEHVLANKKHIERETLQRVWKAIKSGAPSEHLSKEHKAGELRMRRRVEAYLSAEILERT